MKKHKLSAKKAMMALLEGKTLTDSSGKFYKLRGNNLECKTPENSKTWVGNALIPYGLVTHTDVDSSGAKSDDQRRIDLVKKLIFFQSLNKGSYLKYSKEGAPYNTLVLINKYGYLLGRVESFLSQKENEKCVVKHSLVYDPSAKYRAVGYII